MSRASQRIVVAVCTRRRPRMLGELIASFQTLDVPQGAELSFVFVENDDALSISEAVAEFEARSGWPAQAVLMPNLGIAHARNAALDMAIEQGADWLAFVDDDEIVRHDWLRILLSGVRDAGAQMGGGPLRPIAPTMGCSDNESDVLDYLARAAAKSDARKEAALRAGKRFDLATNNWIAHVPSIVDAGLRFDPAFNTSGGEDTDFSRRAYAAGLRQTWVSGAIVSEEVPPARLTAAYVYDRARAQSITKLDLRRSAHSGASVYAMSQVISKGLSGAIRIAASPILGRYSYYRGLRALGIASGFWAGLRGQGQSQYSEVTGD